MKIISYFFFLLFFCVACQAAPNNKPHTLHFPEDRSVGTVWFSYREANYPSNSREIKACGEVEVEDGYKVWLELEREEKDLSFLSSLSPKFLILGIKWPAAQVSRESLEQLTQFKNLRSLDLSNSNITDSDLLFLSSFPELIHLDLSGTAVTPTGLVHIGQTKNLVSLDLSNTATDEKALQQLAHLSGSLKNLANLNLSNTAVNDKALAHLAHLPSLKQLTLSHTWLTDESIVHLARLKKLNYLNVSDSAISEAGASELKRLLPFDNNTSERTFHYYWGKANFTYYLDTSRYYYSNLLYCQNLRRVKGYKPSSEDLVLKFPQARKGYFQNGESYEHVIKPMGEIILPKTFKLNLFYLKGISISEIGQAFNLPAQQAICRLPYVYGSLRNRKWTNADMLYLKHMSSLEELELDGAKLSSKSFSYLRFLQNLTSLSLYESSIQDQDLDSIISLPKLRRLWLSNTSITDKGISKLAKLTSLEGLSLNETRVTDQGIEKISILPNLRYLKLYRTQIGDPSIQSLAKAQHLSSLDVSHTQITDSGVEAASQIKELRELNLEGNSRLTDRAVFFAVEKLNLVNLEFNDTNITDASLPAFQKWIPSEEGNGKDMGVIHVMNTRLSDEGLRKLEAWGDQKAGVDVNSGLESD